MFHTFQPRFFVLSCKVDTFVSFRSVVFYEIIFYLLIIVPSSTRNDNMYPTRPLAPKVADLLKCSETCVTVAKSLEAGKIT